MGISYQLDTVFNFTPRMTGAKKGKPVDFSTPALAVMPNTQFSGLATMPLQTPIHMTDPNKLQTNLRHTAIQNESFWQISTPIKPDRLHHHLTHIGYDKGTTDYLVNGFANGFYLDNYAPVQNISAKNSKAVKQSESVVAEKIDQELKAGRIAGPFDTPPFDPFHISPLNIREKKTPGKYRLLHNLSYPYDGTSINANIPQNCKKVTYSTVNDAIYKLLHLPIGAYTAKSDIADAFRLVPIHPSEYPKLGFSFREKFYFDKNLPQGCASSCRIFETFSTALQAILEFYCPEVNCVHMIDDFFFIAKDSVTCQSHLQSFLDLCTDLGVPIAPHKTTTPTFLGVQLDRFIDLLAYQTNKI